MKKPRILITNDDGIHAPGLLELWKSLSKLGHLTIVAPHSEQSATSLSLTIRQPLKIHSIPWEQGTSAWAVTGTPADCVKMALSVILKEPPDIIVSGMNRGGNAGRTALYSGTVACVIESAMQGIPGVAFSCTDYMNPEYEEAAHYVPAVVQYLLDSPLPRGTVLNVNFPGRVEGGFKGLKLARQGKSFWKESPSSRKHPSEGDDYYWLGFKIHECEEHENSDVHWLRQGYVTAVPLHVEELTDHHELATRKVKFEGIIKK